MQPGDAPPVLAGQMPLFTTPEPGPAERLTQLRQANQTKLLDLNRLGSTPDPVGVVLTRINCLLDVLFDDEARTQYDIVFETLMARVLDQGLIEARRRSLTVGAQQGPAPKLIIPG